MYKIMYCKDCNAVLITDEDIDCLVCNDGMEEIGFTDKLVQDLINLEEQIIKENNNEG